jgi:hypothetical protein
MSAQANTPLEISIRNGKRLLRKKAFIAFMPYDHAEDTPGVPTRLDYTLDPAQAVVDSIQLVPVVIHFTKKGMYAQTLAELESAQMTGTWYVI